MNLKAIEELEKLSKQLANSATEKSFINAQHYKLHLHSLLSRTVQIYEILQNELNNAPNTIVNASKVEALEDKKMVSPTSEPKQTEVAKPIVKEPIAEHKKVAIEPINEVPSIEAKPIIVEPKIEPEKKQEPIHIIQQPFIIAEPEKTIVEKEQKLEAQKIIIQEPKVSGQSINERLKSTTTSLNDRLNEGKESKKSLAEQHNSKPIKNIKASLSINQKIAFQNHIFKGNATLMAETIEKLDACSNFNEAMELLLSNNNITKDHPNFSELELLISRRFN